MSHRDDPLRLVRYVASGAVDGVAAGWVCLLALMHLDIGRIGTLIHATDAGPMVFAIALVFFGVTFGMVGIAWRVMVMLPNAPD